MASTINTNIASINAQRNLGMSAASLTTSMQRLSSGLRVNSAKDDAAGLAIAERMNTGVRGLTVASRNANDGISLAQTTEGALGKVGDMLQRMRELAVQAGNATNSTSDRASLQAEVTQLRDEIDRVAKQTTFNGQKVLDGSFAGAVFQVGANSGDVVALGGLTNTTAAGLSSVDYAAYSAALGGADVAGIDPSGLESIAGSAIEIEITDAGGNSQVFSLGPMKAASSGSERLGQVVAAINAKTADTGITAYLASDGAGGFSFQLMNSRMDTTTTGAVAAVEISGLDAATGLTGLDVSDADFLTASSGDAATANAAFTSIGIETISVETQANAWVALKKIDAAIDQVNAARADLGAMQSRFESAVANIDIQVENLAASRGRIMDADFAKETANLSRAQILQQAGTAMVAQANQLPQGVLQLLRS